MSRLSKQSIRRLCEGPAPMIYPFEPSKVRVQGVSKGLSHASYDASIAHDLVLGRHPGVVIGQWVEDTFGHMDPATRYSGRRWWEWLAAVHTNVLALNKLLTALVDLAKRLRDEPKWYSLAYTVEDFHMPPDVGGDVADKSTFARVFVSAFNTFFDPGFRGNATLELVNHSSEVVQFEAGQGVCQFIFTWLDEATEEPYAGKYQHQVMGEGAARYEPDTLVVTQVLAEVADTWSDIAGKRFGPVANAEQRRECAIRAYHPQPVPKEILEGLNRAVDLERTAANQKELDKLRFGRFGGITEGCGSPEGRVEYQARLEAMRDRAGLGQG